MLAARLEEANAQPLPAPNQRPGENTLSIWRGLSICSITATALLLQRRDQARRANCGRG